MTTSYQRIEQDLLENIQNKRILQRPYNHFDKPKRKVEKWRKEFRRAKYHNQKVDLKILYYYLGETLEQEELPRSITKHERITAKRIFIIHEPIGPEYLSGKATLADYKGLTQENTMTLREKALEVLSEREPLVGENLLSENVDAAEIQSPQQEDWSHDDQQDMTIMGIMENMRNMENIRNMTLMENIPNIRNMVDMGDMSNMLDMTDMVGPVEE
jgi:hypothetical protein